MNFNNDQKMKGRFTEKFLDSVINQSDTTYIVVTGIPWDEDDIVPEYGMSLQSVINYMFNKGWKYVSHCHKGNIACLDIVFMR
jgi:hypothetical protein